MKMISLTIMLLFLLGAPVTNGDDQNYYHNNKIGVSFNYPKKLTIDRKSSKKDPLSVVFVYGTTPFAVHILFKELTGTNNLEEFIMKERKEQVTGGYRDQIKEMKHFIEGKYPAIEFIRTSEMGKIYYFVFPVQKSRKLFALWHVTSQIADPQGDAVKGFYTMINSLQIVQ